MKNKVVKITNKWFCEKFLPSFGLCESKKITEKQGRVFEKYLEEDEHSRNQTRFCGFTSGCKIILCRSSNRYWTNWYVTVKVYDENKIKEYREELQKLDNLWDEIDSRTDISEEEKDDLLEKVNNRWFEINNLLDEVR